MSADAPGYSMTPGQLAHLQALGITPAPPSNPGKSAQLLAAKYFADNPELGQDPRLRSGSLAQQHADAVAKALVLAGYRGDATKAAHGLPVDADVPTFVAKTVAAQPAPAPTRSAETLLSRRL